MSHPISRHFVTIEGRRGPRQVHYRRAGAGPAVLMLHQSPQSSREFCALMQRWAVHFTVIAPDTPGYGQSDPLAAQAPDIDMLADALAEFVDAIGLRRFGIYGYHTGASIGLWYAVAHPERVSALAANGLAQFSEDECRLMLEKYLPPVIPAWDGSHLAWMWARMREQALFFPWHERRAATRLPFDMPPAAALQAAFMEFLRAGRHYASAYAAAMQARPDAVLGRLRVPLLVTAAAGDPLQAHFPRLQALPDDAGTIAADSREEALAQCLSHLLARRADPCPAPVATRPIAGRTWNRMLHLPAGQLRVRMQTEGHGRPLVVVHDAGKSADTAERLVRSLVGSRSLLLIDLPGHGESDPAGDGGPRLAECTELLRQAIGEAGLDACVVAGQGAGAWVALEASRDRSSRIHALALLDPPFLDEDASAGLRAHGLPAIEPQWHGGHLLEAWHMLRDGRLFFPWFERRADHARRTEPDLDEWRLQEELLDLLRAPQTWRKLLAAALDYPAAGALAATSLPLAIGAAADGPWLAVSRDAASCHSGSVARQLPAGEARWLPALLEALGTDG